MLRMRGMKTNAGRILLSGVVQFAFVSSLAVGQTVQTLIDVDTPGLLIESAAGWDGTVDTSVPVPISFLIKNSSERVIEGRMTLSDRIRGHTVSLGDVFVSPQSTKRMSSIQAMSRWDECIATLEGDGRILWRRELTLASGNAFQSEFNFALFIDRQRKLQLPNSAGSGAVVEGAVTPVTGENGRPIRSLAVRPWQVPDHAGPLHVAQAIVFSESAVRTDLTPTQWRAVASWMCQGGTIFVYKDSDEVIEQLTRSAPLDVLLPFDLDSFQVRRSGLGAIYEYAEPLSSTAGIKIAGQIGEAVSRMTKNHNNTQVAEVYQYDQGQADINRVLVLAFFGFYTLVSGLVTLMLFRVSQRKLTTYIAVVVVGASALAVVLGGYLRVSSGDLEWVTVTELGDGGAVQRARIDVQSSGGRGQRVAVRGHHADIQVVELMPWYRYGWRDHAGPTYRPFTWQANRAENGSDAFQINVPITPWGNRRIQGTAFNQKLSRLDFTLSFTPSSVPAGQMERSLGGAVTPAGRCELKVVNELPVDLSNCYLLIGVTQTDPTGIQGMSDMYHLHPLRPLKAGETLEETFDAGFTKASRNNYSPDTWAGRWLIRPVIRRQGAASAWIVGEIESSPELTIDAEQSDFTLKNERHLVIQEILPEDMPDISLFLKQSGKATEEGAGEAEAAPEAGMPD